MPLYWKYFSKEYLKIFLLSTFGFISVLLITRLKDIAKFAAIATDIKTVILYVIFQIPHILPIAIPISCLISAFILFQRFSLTSELTALRASGLSLRKIITPVITISFFISFLNFFIISEITPYCRIESKKIGRNAINLNPILLLEKQELLQIKNSYIDLKTSHNKNSAKDFIFIIPNKATSRLNFISAKKIQLDKENLIGKNVSIISSFPQNPPHIDDYDDFILENQGEMITPAKELSQQMKKKKITLNINQLPTKTLFQNKNKISLSEIIRRAVLSFSAFSLTFIGICFAVDINRIKSTKKLLIATFCALLIFLSFIVGKSIKHAPLTSMLIYLIPQPLILLFSMKRLKNISKGID